MPLPAIGGETARPESRNDAADVFRCSKQTKGRQIRFAALEPGESPPITRKLAGQALKRGRRNDQGVGV